jgi:hypothetical protein
MSHNLYKEQLYPLRIAARRFAPRSSVSGKAPHVATLRRWASKGVSVNGRRIVLETVNTPSGLATSAEAIRRFLKKINRRPGACEKRTSPSSRTRRSERREAKQAAEKELDEAGI